MVTEDRLGGGGCGGGLSQLVEHFDYGDNEDEWWTFTADNPSNTVSYSILLSLLTLSPWLAFTSNKQHRGEKLVIPLCGQL